MRSMLKEISDGSRDPANLTSEGAYRAEYVDSIVRKLAGAIVDINDKSWRQIKDLKKTIKELREAVRELSARLRDLNIAAILPVSPDAVLLTIYIFTLLTEIRYRIKTMRIIFAFVPCSTSVSGQFLMPHAKSCSWTI